MHGIIAVTTKYEKPSVTKSSYDCNYLWSVSRLLEKFPFKSHYSNLCKVVAGIIFPRRKLLRAELLLQPIKVGAKCLWWFVSSAPTTWLALGSDTEVKDTKPFPPIRAAAGTSSLCTAETLPSSPQVWECAWYCSTIPPQLYPPLPVYQEPLPQTFYMLPDSQKSSWPHSLHGSPSRTAITVFPLLFSPAICSPSGIRTLGRDVNNLLWLQEEERMWNCFPVHGMATWSMVFEATTQTQLVKSTFL